MLNSFFSIAKNGGYFVSEKQANFLLSKCEDGVYIHSQTYSFGNSSTSNHVISYVVKCNSKGITKIEKHSQKTGKVTVTFERTLNEDDAKSLKSNNLDKREFFKIANEAFEVVKTEKNNKEVQIKLIYDKLLNEMLKCQDITKYHHLKALELVCSLKVNHSIHKAFSFVCG